ncbi:hypothetical protein MMC13_005679 [Lambiella insularis]|nr:hypothetical protein [Lambiella insularis]
MVLYAFGSNSAGQLGIGHSLDCSVPACCKSDTSQLTLSSLPLKVAAGGSHALVLHSTGRVSITGNVLGRSFESFRALNLEGRHPDVSVKEGHKFKFCSTTWEVSTLVDADSLIYTFGSGDRGQLGRGSEVTVPEDFCPPLDASFLPPDTSVTDLASGLQHTVIVLSNGEVYGWGNGRKGQLGEPTGIVSEPRKITGLDFQVVRAVCGREFTYFVGDPGKGQHLILGPDKFQIQSRAPHAVPGWKDIGASWGSIYVLDHSGKIVSWGRNDYGQLAYENLPAVNKMATGSEHVLALTLDGKVLAWGWGEHGNCGPGVDRNEDAKSQWNEIKVPKANQVPAVVGIGAGCATSWLWTTIS